MMSSDVQRPAVVITGLPWLRTGSGKVMEEQVAFFKSIGWIVFFVACPFTAKQTLSHPIWEQFKQQSSDLAADAIAIAAFEKPVRRRGLFGKLEARWKNLNALHWRMSLSQMVILTDELRDDLRAADVRLILANHVYTLELAKRIKAEVVKRNVPLCVVTHDVQSHILSDNSIVNPFTKRPDRLQDLEETEVRALLAAQYLIHVSHDDLSFFQRRVPAIRQTAILPCAPDRTDLGGDRPNEKGADFLFVGSNHIANSEAIEWLLKDVYPNFDKPKPSLRIVGKVDRLIEAKHPDLINRYRSFFIGEVPDLIDEYLSARCILIPMISGRGVSIKTVEATSMGLPIVGGAAAFRGLPSQAVKNSGLSIYLSAGEFATAAQEALRNPGPFREASISLYHALFSREAFATSMVGVLNDLDLNSIRTPLSSVHHPA
jgi:polysaccharide biosynthesis protein PslH